MPTLSNTDHLLIMAWPELPHMLFNAYVDGSQVLLIITAAASHDAAGPCIVLAKRGATLPYGSPDYTHHMAVLTYKWRSNACNAHHAKSAQHWVHHVWWLQPCWFILAEPECSNCSR